MEIKGDFLRRHLIFPWQRRRRKFFQIVKAFFLAVVIIIIAGGFFIYPFIGTARDIYALAKEGRNNLEQAEDYAGRLDLENAEIFLIKAESDLSAAREKFAKFYLFKKLPIIGKQVSALDNLLLTGIETTSAVKEIVLVAKDIFKTVEMASILSGQTDFGEGDLSFDKISKEQKKRILKTLFESSPQLQGAKAKIDLAMLSFNQIPEDEIFYPFKKAIEPLRDKLPALQETISKAIPASEILPQVLGYPYPKTYLFLLQNNHEIRPTGGFIGTFGIVKLDSGDLVTFATDNIYKLDFSVINTLKVNPPEPLKKYLLGQNGWFLRDSNWSPDFPTSARQAEWFYNQEIQSHLNKGEDDIWKATVEPKIDGVIAITPNLIRDLLKLVGQIKIDGQIFDAENLVEALEYQVEKGYYEQGVPDIQRKEIVGKLAVELKKRLFELPSSRWPEALDILKKNLNEKQVLVYDNSADLQMLVDENNWGGALVKYDGDYLSVIDSNMASLKTDQVMARKINYTVSVEGDDLIAEAGITYTNNGNFSWKTTRYRTYTRFYVPQGSELIEVRGAMENDKVKDPERKPGQADVGEELGKTYFGAFVAVEPGETRSLSVKYRLPKWVKTKYDLGLYKLFVQKQSGTEGHSLTIDLNFDKKIKSWLPLGYSSRQQSDKQIKFIYTLRQDRESLVQF
ncbi:MAG: DUF4012 domain-containing protein [Patescibacteria group bacterium]|nr:DUF4012 domain-containing protein [Patescibacteria group bacterium]MDD5490381.1 DUF4012 domain-containing protein [Patescibacteria group bacterium]